jgi:ribosome biogenesis GTPase
VDLAGAMAAVSGLGSGARVEVLAISSVEGQGLAAIRKRIRQGRTVVLMGRSGVGKSTLINQLAGEETQYVRPVREDDQKGRHATTSREMVFLTGGGVIIDTPGLRELQLWEGAEGLETTFADIEAMAVQCRFTNCRHEAEPGCAVRQALCAGILEATRLAAFFKLRSEVAEFARRRDIRARADGRRQARNRRRHGPMDED